MCPLYSAQPPKHPPAPPTAGSRVFLPLLADKREAPHSASPTGPSSGDHIINGIMRWDRTYKQFHVPLEDGRGFWVDVSPKTVLLTTCTCACRWGVCLLHARDPHAAAQLTVVAWSSDKQCPHGVSSGQCENPHCQAVFGTSWDCVQSSLGEGVGSSSQQVVDGSRRSRRLALAAPSPAAPMPLVVLQGVAVSDSGGATDPTHSDVLQSEVPAESPIAAETPTTEACLVCLDQLEGTPSTPSMSHAFANQGLWGITKCCANSMHAHCLYRWLSVQRSGELHMGNPTCPLCRAPLTGTSSRTWQSSS